MPEYMKEQIADAKAALIGIMSLAATTGKVVLNNCKQLGADICTVLSALATAEQERDDQYRKNLELVETYAKLLGEEKSKVRHLEARCAELEARMQGAGWISVDERLPPMGTPFDVWDNIHKCRLADHGAFTGSWDDDFRRETMLIKGFTHWMLRPGAPVIHSAKKDMRFVLGNLEKKQFIPEED